MPDSNCSKFCKCDAVLLQERERRTRLLLQIKRKLDLCCGTVCEKDDLMALINQCLGGKGE